MTWVRNMDSHIYMFSGVGRYKDMDDAQEPGHERELKTFLAKTFNVCHFMKKYSLASKQHFHLLCSYLPDQVCRLETHHSENIHIWIF